MDSGDRPCPYCRETNAEQRHARPRQARNQHPKSASTARADRLSEFEGDQICSFRSYWDDLPVLQDIREAEAG